ncbi:ABC transporter ATP-binding protein [Microbacterium sp. P07]|uniref:ABC transporter ATP-binding protein n=1 Tax=Microbacterium sp. P07 TaxID=3366952 RepID=UPI003745610F
MSATTAVSATIVATGLRRSFGSVPAVRDVSLRAEAGRVTGLVGPNGSGKTTLMLMLSSLLAPDAGEISIGGFDPVEHPQEVRRILGWMPDSLGAWGSLSARETLVITGRLYDATRDAARERADDLLRLVDLETLAEAPARVLSRGQKQRLGLARALVHDPLVLLLDEPASGLDPEARVALRVLLRRLADEGRAVLVSSHVLSELEEVADDAVFLLDGATVAPDRVAAASRRRRAWRVRLADAAPAASVSAVAHALHLDPADLTAERLGVLVPLGSDGDAAAALRALVEAGLAVVEFAPATGSLEHTLLDLRDGSPT